MTYCFIILKFITCFIDCFQIISSCNIIRYNSIILFYHVINTSTK